MKKQGVISDIGEVISFDRSFNPQVNIYDEREPDYIKRTMMIECPGVLEDDVTWAKDGAGISLRIEKKKLIDEGSVTSYCGLRQQSGVFEKKFTVPSRLMRMLPHWRMGSSESF